MSRSLRIEFPGAVYHVTARGIERRNIFSSERNKEDLLSLFALLSERHGHERQSGTGCHRNLTNTLYVSFVDRRKTLSANQPKRP
jgi:hypothetical protein